MNGFFLGVDGGGTKTLAAICDANGHILGRGSSGPSNIDDVGLEPAAANISQAVNIARAAANLEPQPFAAAFLGLAGVVSTRDRALTHGIAERLELAAPDHIGVDHDCRIALAGGLAGRSGAVLIVGTGSSCYGVNDAGEAWRSGGWGSLISDEGSGYFLGREGLIAAVRSLDGRGPSSSLADALLKSLGVTQPDDLLHRLYVTGLTRSEIAALAPIILDSAADGDAAALEIVERGSDLLAECVAAVAQHLRLERFELVVGGGLYNASLLVQNMLHGRLLGSVPQCRIVTPELPPVLGACLLALGGVASSAAIERLKLEQARI